MRTARIAIVGGGVSGLYAACLLEQQGITDWILLAGRDVLGGRKLSVPVSTHGVSEDAGQTNTLDRVDLGPSWHGGTDWVRQMRRTDAGVELCSEDVAGRVTRWCAEQVLLAMPPRLVVGRIEFVPPLPAPLAQAWLATATWMAPHAKYFAVYDRPFCEQGLSGEARSARGPLGEIHDASMPGGSAALFGFLGVPARVRQGMPDDVRSHCRAQPARLSGPQAGTPRAEFLKDWALDTYTATVADGDSSSHHPEAPATGASAGPGLDA